MIKKNFYSKPMTIFFCLLFVSFTSETHANDPYRASAYDEELTPSWAEESIAKVKEAEIMTGKDDGNFYPYDPVNRAQMVTILLRMKDQKLEDRTASHPFTDVPSGVWYEEAVLLSLQEEWVKGRTANTFEPSRDINRAEFAVLLYRVFEMSVDSSEMAYEDVSEDDWFYEAINALYSKDLVRFPNASKYDPDKKVSRAEAAWVIARIMGKPGLYRTDEAPPVFVGGSPRNSKKVSIRPHDFNAEKQGYEVEKIGTSVDSDPINPEETVRPGEGFVYLGEIILSNSLTEDVNVQNIEFHLDFLEGQAGPAENFTLEIKTDSNTTQVDITREKTGAIKYTELLVEASRSISIKVYVKARENETYTLDSGLGTVYVSDVEAFFYDPNRNDNETYVKDVPSRSPVIFEDRYLGRFNFEPNSLDSSSD